MVKYILFMDVLRKEEIDMFYDVCATNFMACQMQREYYKGYPKAYHPLTYFREGKFMWQCPPEMSHVYLSYPQFHVKYKQPVGLPPCTGRTSGIPSAPDRILGGRYDKNACKKYTR